MNIKENLAKTNTTMPCFTLQNQCFSLFSHNSLKFERKSRGRSASARGGLTAWSIWEILRPISRMHYFLMAKHISFGLNTSPFLWVRIKISKIFMPAQPPPYFANFNEHWRESCKKKYHNTVFYNAESMFSIIFIRIIRWNWNENPGDGRPRQGEVWQPGQFGKSWDQSAECTTS